MGYVLLLAFVGILVWVLSRSGGGGGGRGGGSEALDDVDDLVLHDEVSPGDAGDVGDRTDGR